MPGTLFELAMPLNPPFKSEDEFITLIRSRAPQRSTGLSLGIGDDAALLTVSPGQELILTTDMSIEGVHFAPKYYPPRAVGHRALARSLSDIAAMGGTPRYALLSLAVPLGTRKFWLKDFLDGFSTLARQFKVAVVGGDTAVLRGPLVADVIVGGVVPRGQALRRSSAHPGDRIFVSGVLGMSALGLRVLRTGKRVRKAIEKTAIQAHLFPQPQCALGRFLSSHRLASAMMDLSDGLSIDLARLCKASGVGARLTATRIPAPPMPDVEEALKLALHGGEDYQLLFTVPRAKASRIPPSFGKVPLTCIGEIRSGGEVRIMTSGGKSQLVRPEGFDHFRRR